MHVFIVYAHPSEESFTHLVLLAFIDGLRHSKHTFEVSDLYKMQFKSDMEFSEYERESGKEPNRLIPEDVKREQAKINSADALAFIYPVWWSDCPAKMKGWFDRVYTLGFAYAKEDRKNTRLKIQKALVICAAGHPVEYLEEIGIAQSIRTVMLKDRLLGVGVEQVEMVILGGMVSNDSAVWERNLQVAFALGKNINLMRE